MTEELLHTETGAPALTTPEPVRLVTSARFIVEMLALPPGIAPRDIQGFLEGEAEERSLFPLESTSWGYMEARRKNRESLILLYSAFREQVNGASDPQYAERHAVLPGFAVLLGRSWRKTTWLTLQEPDCITLVRIPSDTGVPDVVRSRYIEQPEEDPQQVWALHDILLSEVEIGDDERVEEGLIRCSKPNIDRKGGVVFPLERCRAPGEGWKRFGHGRILGETTLLSADVRDSRYLNEVRNRRRAVRQLRVFLRLSIVMLIGLTLFQFRYIQLKNKTARLTEQLTSQRPAVKALQEQEALSKSAGRISDPPLEIFAWLTAVNDVRPDVISFLSTSADRDGRLGVSGEAPSVAAVNQFRDGLNKTNSFKTVETKEINSGKSGVKFTIQVQMNADEKAEDGGEA